MKKNFVAKHPILFSIIIVVLAVGITSGLVAATNGFKESPIKRNEANLITVGTDSNIELEDKAQTNGLKIDVKDDGAVTIFGNTSSSKVGDVLLYATVELKAGTYCLSSGYNNTNPSTVYMAAMKGDEELVKADMSDTGKPGVFELTEDATVELYIHIAAAKYENAITLKPVLVTGDSQGDFYA